MYVEGKRVHTRRGPVSWWVRVDVHTTSYFVYEVVTRFGRVSGNSRVPDLDLCFVTPFGAYA